MLIIPFIYDNIETIKKIDNIDFYILPSQENEIDKHLGIRKHKILKDTLKIYKVKQTAGVFFLNVFNINVPRYFVDTNTEKTIKNTLLVHNCNHKGQENFMADFDIAYSAYCNDYTVLTNDGAGKKDGLYRALKELNIQCLSHEEFKSFI